ncbi:HD domain-containing protein [Lentinula raphanica]|nr:HD domain-containing protein [Lentinula raphanica]
MHRMAVLAMCTTDSKLDVAKCVMLSVVHDLAEAQVGDIAPSHGISKEEKSRLESEAIHTFVHDMLHNSPAAQRIEALWKEYEDRETPEARFVKGDKYQKSCIIRSQSPLTSPFLDLDRFEMATQALEYERLLDGARLQPFYDSSIPYIEHPEVQEWGKDLLAERGRLFDTRTSS